uniref:NADH-ubiquinone oxidoreductase chain 2 n=1 Tax=Streptocephalus sirindhornae TaxID=91588 RepID=A0A0U1Z3C6_9CRUS|nr:NADH dehydrogenase subunit 2 [Streptocephalus sirindhornae]AJP09648.1 NADH dehydrogenase subunit 2 [Streptocephalus sirindhornae]
MVKWLSLLLSYLIMLSSESWLGLWLGLELNSLSFIPILIGLSKEVSLKYFLVQSFGSVLFLLGIFNPSFSILSSLGLLLKTGVAPLHFWVISVTKNMSWSLLMILLTTQKLGPLLGLAMSGFSSLMVIILSALLGSLGGFIQSNMRLIITFSSIAHLSWLLINLSSMPLFFTYFSVYCFISVTLGVLFQKMKIFNISQMNFSQDLLLKTSLSLSLLSLGGLPPLLGFFIKWMTIELSLLSLLLCSVLVFSTCLSLFFYLKIVLVPQLSPFNYSIKWDNMVVWSLILNCVLPLFLL